jgi:hypothetical protein
LCHAAEEGRTEVSHRRPPRPRAYPRSETEVDTSEEDSGEQQFPCFTCRLEALMTCDPLDFFIGFLYWILALQVNNNS